MTLTESNQHVPIEPPPKSNRPSNLLKLGIFRQNSFLDWHLFVLGQVRDVLDGAVGEDDEAVADSRHDVDCPLFQGMRWQLFQMVLHSVPQHQLCVVENAAILKIEQEHLKIT